MSNNLSRGFICLIGVGAIVWGIFVLPLFWQQAAPQSVAARLVDSQSFSYQSLLDEAQQAQKATQHEFCVPAALRSLYVLRLFILNKGIAESNQALIGASYVPVRVADEIALSCAPADAFGWLTLFWLDAAKYGPNEKNLSYLRLSYALAPNEGWIALWRVRLSLRLFERLPADLSSDAVDDFINFVNTGSFYLEMADIFKGASAVAQRRIVDRISIANPVTQQAFARALRDRGVDADIPGVDKPTRPWQ
jgi:hypothetical protein